MECVLTVGVVEKIKKIFHRRPAPISSQQLAITTTTMPIERISVYYKEPIREVVPATYIKEKMALDLVKQLLDNNLVKFTYKHIDDMYVIWRAELLVGNKGDSNE